MFELVQLNATSVYDAVASESLDFLLTDPATFVCLSIEFAATFLATRSNLARAPTSLLILLVVFERIRSFMLFALASRSLTSHKPK